MNNEKQKELDKYRTLLNAVIDYNIKYYTGSIVLDEWDPEKDFYLQERRQAEKDYQDFSLDLLQNRFGQMMRRLRDRKDSNFLKFIKEQTGYEIKILEDINADTSTVGVVGALENKRKLKRVNLIINQNGQSNFLGRREVRQFTFSTDEIDQVVHKENVLSIGSQLDMLIKPRSKNESSAKANSSSSKRNNPFQFTRFSPDGERQIKYQTNGIEETALAEISIMLKGGSGSIYCVRGSTAPINAYWKDNHTIVIETKPEYIAELKRHCARSFEDVIKIEYIES